MNHERPHAVWLLERGDMYYEDYELLGVFSSEENALIASRVIGGGLIQHPLDPCIDELKQGKSRYIVWTQFDGSWEAEEVPAYRAGDLTPSMFQLYKKDSSPIGARVRAGHGKPTDWLTSYVWAHDKGGAAAVADVQRRAMIERGEWG